MKRVAVLSFTLLAVGVVLFLSLRLFRQNSNEKAYKEQVQELSSKVKQSNLELIQKEKELMEPIRNSIEQVEKRAEEQVERKGISVSYRISDRESGKKLVELYLNGSPGMSMDAADVVLSIQNASVSALQSGDAFPSYPRLSVVGDKVVMTGVALLGQAHVEFGAVNKTYATFEVEKKDLNQKAVVTLEKTQTGIYLLGNGVDDLELSFSSIEW